jgi:serine/threonine protein kinase
MPVQVERLAEPIPGYKLIERLGGGGFGEVWKAEAPGGLLKAIKFVYGDLHTTGDEGMRAEQELKALSRVKTVRHPYILSLERFDIVDGRLIIVMELADRNLWDRFRECQAEGLPGIPRDELLRYMEETAEALDLMNTQYQLQHLDIKPQNIFLVQNHVKVADFGLVKDLQGMAASVTGGVTPVYAAPETFDGWISRFCDQYSLSIVYQEMLTGQRPYTAGTVHQLIMQHVKGTPNLASLPPGDQEVVARALAKDPDKRHACCMDMVRLLRSSGASAQTDHTNQALEGQAHPDRFEPKTNGAGSKAPPVSLAPQQPDCGVSPRAWTPGQASSGEESHFSQEVTAVRGDGVLVPALVIGLGMTGLSALQQFRKSLGNRHGSREALPHLRILYIDTDPAAVQLATQENEALQLTHAEVLPARLKRASHFLKPRESRPGIDKWFNHALLYRITRNQETGGLRALGRLSFVDNYRGIVHRLRTELQACAAPKALAAAVKNTRLGMRSNRPRVYIVSSLCGGTGSGMFLDLAYVVRQLLKQIGHAQSEVNGIFLLPPADTPQKMALGNTFAALTELNHFSAPQAIFSARYEDRGPPLESSVAPFSRCIFLPLANGTNEGGQGLATVGELLSQELLTPLGRAADSCRGARQKSLWQDGSLLFQSVNLFRLSWPRRSAMQQAARRYCRHVAKSWIAKDSTPVHKRICSLVSEHELSKELAAESLISRFQTACEQALQKNPETAFAEATEPVRRRSGRGAKLDATKLTETVRKFEYLVGHPSESAVLHGPGFLEEALQQEGEVLAAAAQRKLSHFIQSLIEAPGLRLVGAEEAIRQLMAYIEKVLKHQEPLFQEFAEKATKSHERFQFLMANIEEINKGGRRATTQAKELNELLQLYPKWRYQSLVLRRVTFALTSLRGYLSDQLREISFYRLRLGDLLRAFEDGALDKSVDNPVIACSIFPRGSRTLEEALDHALPTVTAERLEVLDRRIQDVILHQFTSLAHVCTSSTTLLPKLEAAMVAEMSLAIEDHFTGLNIVDMYLDRNPQDQQALEGLAKAFDHAAPVGSSGQDQFAIVTLPSGAQNERFRKLLQHAVPTADIVEAPAADEVVFYREETQAALADLEQVQASGQEAYQQLTATENFTLHSRMDITDWRPINQ